MRKLLLLSATALLTCAVAASSASARSVIVNPSTTPPCTYVGPGDAVPGAAFWYGLRGYTCAYAAPGTNPAIDIVRASDSTSATIAVLSTGALDVATAATFCASTTCTVSKAYDQTGNGQVIIQATAVNQPQLTFNCIGSLPCMTFSGAQWLEGASFSAIAIPWVVSTVYNSTFTGNRWVMGGTTGYPGWVLPSANSLQLFGLSPVPAANGTWHVVNGQNNNTLSQVAIDATGTGAVVGSANAMTSPIGLGSVAGNEAVNAFSGTVTELGGWGAVFSWASEAALCHNQHTYWGTPVTC